MKSTHNGTKIPRAEVIRSDTSKFSRKRTEGKKKKKQKETLEILLTEGFRSKDYCSQVPKE